MVVGTTERVIQRRSGHDVTAAENDTDLVAQSHRLFPDVAVVECDILELTPGLLEAAGRPTS
jgi:phospholipid N-methyltransferase